MVPPWRSLVLVLYWEGGANVPYHTTQRLSTIYHIVGTFSFCSLLLSLIAARTTDRPSAAQKIDWEAEQQTAITQHQSANMKGAAAVFPTYFTFLLCCRNGVDAFTGASTGKGTTSTLKLPLSQRHSKRRPLGLSTGNGNEGNKAGSETSIKAGDEDFWLRQKQLIREMQESSEASLRAEMREKFAKQRQTLVGDTAYIGFFIFCGLWMAFSNPFIALSYGLGNILGLAYTYGLGRYVETIGGQIGDEGTTQGAGVGQARFAFIILLFIFVGKFRSAGLLEIPSIAGFFTYQIASFSQVWKGSSD